MWIDIIKTDMRCVDQVRECALRIVYNDRISDYRELVKRVKTCTIETGWKRQLVTNVYQAGNGHGKPSAKTKQTYYTT